MKAAVQNRRTSEPVAPSSDAPDAGISDPVEARRRRLAAQGRGMTVLGDLDAPDRAPPGPPLFLHVPREDATPEQRRGFFARHRSMRVPEAPLTEKSSRRQMIFPRGDGLSPLRVWVDTNPARPQQSGPSALRPSLFQEEQRQSPTRPLQTAQHDQAQNEPSASGELAEDSVRRFPGREELPPHHLPDPNPPSQAKLKRTEESARGLVEWGKSLGLEVASDMLETWLEGRLGPNVIYRVPADWARAYLPVRSAEAQVKEHFENWLAATGEEYRDKNYGFPTLTLVDGADEIEIGNLRRIDAVRPGKEPEEDRSVLFDPHRSRRAAWESDLTGKLRIPIDQALSIGGGKVVGIALLKMKRRGDRVFVRGSVHFQLHDRYDWDEEKTMQFRTSILGVPDFSQRDFNELERFGTPNAFDVRSQPWVRQIRAWLRIKNGKVVDSIFKWLDP